MKILDLFCGAGGAGKGLSNRGKNKVIGIDHINQPEYFEYKNFRVYDVFDYLKDANIEQFNFIWASPPCQAYSWAAGKSRGLGKKYPNLIAKTRRALKKTGKPFIIENVCSAPIRKDLMLCGEMFNLRVIRHRYFELHNFKVKQPEHKKHRGTVKGGYYVTVAGHGGDGKASLKSWQKGIGINWIKDKKVLAQCVPPKYSNYIIKEFEKNDQR